MREREKKSSKHTELIFAFSQGRDSFIVNTEFEGLSARDLADPSLANWVHHVQYVLPQVKSKNRFQLSTKNRE